MKNFSKVILVTGLLVFLCLSGMGRAADSVKYDQLYQISTLPALMEGGYDGETTFGDLKRHGDVGIGTFNRLDGEMIEVDGLFYQIKADGKAYPVDDKQKTPFAAVTFFENDRSFAISKPMKLAELTAAIDQTLPGENIFYVVRIKGAFSYVKTRSVPAQVKPYPPLSEVVKDQSVFELRDLQGVIIGVRCPAYVSGVNLPGFHLHFIDNKRTVGGHLLDGVITAGTVEIDYIYDFYLKLPQSGEFEKLDLDKDNQQAIKKAEN
jgi:acetolactate decarboxylase